VRELEGAEIVLVQRLSMLTRARQPDRDGGLSVAEDPLGSRRIQPFSERGQYQSNVVRWGFQVVQGSVAPSAERGGTGRASKRLDRFSAAMFAISDQSVDVSRAKYFRRVHWLWCTLLHKHIRPRTVTSFNPSHFTG
jgi:hypothetical protein